MARNVTRRDFMVFVAAGSSALVASCRPRSATGQPMTMPTLVPEDFAITPTASPAPGSIPTIPPQFLQPDPAFSQITFDREMIVTPVENFYVQAFQRIAEVNLTDWTLTIDGLVRRPLTLRFDDLRQMESVTETRTLECIGNPLGGNLIGNAVWTGVRLAPLLEEAGIRNSAAYVKMHAADEYQTAVTLDWIVQQGTLLVYAMNDQPLTADHGYPLRIMMPGLYGQKMPKWLTRIEFIDREYYGYWETHGWSNVCEVKTNSQIVLPPNLASVNGAFALQGWAYAGRRAIVSVEIKVEDGEWMACDLLHGPSSLTWTQWWTAWTPQHAGTFNVAVRATDEDGFTQEREGQPLLASSYPDGQDAIHSVTYIAG